MTLTPQEREARLAAAAAKIAAGELPKLVDREHELALEKVRNRALRLLEVRLRSSKELKDRLLRLEFDPDLVQELIDRFNQVGLLNDELFAKEWVRQRHQLKKKTRAALDFELKAKGISAPLRAKALAQISASAEDELAAQLAAKKARTIKTIPEGYQEYQKALAKIAGLLGRKGFSSGIIYEVATAALDERINELAEQSAEPSE